MFRARSIPLCFGLAFLLSISSPAAKQSNPWLQINSAHFTVVTDAGERKGREIALRFEQIRGEFADLLSRDHLHQSVPLTIFAFGDDRWFYQAAPLEHGHPLEAPAFVLAGDDQDFIVLNAAEENSWRAAAHDYVLILLRYNYPPVQGWFDEGMAQCFGSIRMDGKQIEIGADPTVAKAGGGAQSFTALLNAGPWMPLLDLFGAKPDTNHPLYQAESWIVMDYLIHEKKLPETGAYFGLALNRNVPIEDAVKQAYGMTSAELESAVKNYFREGAVSSSQVAPGTPAPAPLSEIFPTPVPIDDSTMISKPLLEADARAMYADIQVRVPERRELGLKTLHDLASTPTESDKKAASKTAKRMGEDEEQLPVNAVGNPMAHRILAWDHIQHGEFDEALAEIKDAAALNPNDMWLRYYLSAAKYRVAQAKHTDIPGLANMMLDLKSVLEWYPDMADAYDLLAVARNTGGGASAALQAERAAITLSPREQRYSLHLAQIYIANKKWDAANALLNRLKASPDAKIASAAAELQSQAGAERKYGIPVGSGQLQSKYEEQRSPFDVLEQDAAKRTAGENADGTPVGDARPTKFLKGRLLSVDCSKAPAAVLRVSSGTSILKLQVADYKSVLLIGADDFSCDWRDVAVTVNYKSGKGSEGDLVSLEVR